MTDGRYYRVWTRMLAIAVLLPAGLSRAEPASPADTFGTPVETRPAKHRYGVYPQVANISTGLSWPEGQALPVFATPAQTLDAIEVQALSPDEQITFSALQGQVNKQQPRIYLLDARADEGRDTWANTATVGFKSLHHYGREDRFDLVAKYARELAGVVLYDPDLSPHYRNLAGTIAGLENAIPVTAEVHRHLRERGVELKVVTDLTSLGLTSPLEIYPYLYEKYWGKCTKRFIVSARPDSRRGDCHHTRDIAAACGAAVVWLDNRIPEQRQVTRRFLIDMQAGNAIILGWYSSERSGITTASEFGIGTLPADHYMSATVYSGTDHRIRIPAVPRRPGLENKVYVAVFISDGDNIQYTQRAMRRIWDRSADSRGQVAMNWTIAPGLVDIGPGILNYYYTTATPQDCFVTGPSGMGYMMPFNTLDEEGAPVGLCLADADRTAGYCRLTETYLQRSGIRVVTIWDDATPMHRRAYEQQCRSLYGATVQNFKDVPSVQGSVENQRVRFDKLMMPYITAYGQIRGSLVRELNRWDGKSPKFLSYQVSVWGEMKPDRIVALAQDINARFPGQVAFVRADHYFNLYNEAHGLPFNLARSAKTSVRDGSSSASAALAVDGTPATVWTANDHAAPWLQFDFGDVYLLNRYVLRYADDSGASPDKLHTRACSVQVSENGMSWITVDVFRGNPHDGTDVDIEPVAARYLRITIDDPGSDANVQIAEVEVYGRAARSSDQ